MRAASRPLFVVPSFRKGFVFFAFLQSGEARGFGSCGCVCGRRPIPSRYISFRKVFVLPFSLRSLDYGQERDLADAFLFLRRKPFVPSRCPSFQKGFVSMSISDHPFWDFVSLLLLPVGVVVIKNYQIRY